MHELAASNTLSEDQFAAQVDALVADPHGRAQLRAWLDEAHPLYDERSAAEVVRMRGWLFVALARLGLTDDELLYVLEELETGTDTYLVAAAALALRTHPQPTSAFAPFVIRAISNIRYLDEPVTFDEYGGFAIGNAATSAVRDLLAALSWLGPLATGVVDDVVSLRDKQDGLPGRLRGDINRALSAIRQTGSKHKPDAPCCELPSTLKNVLSWSRWTRRGCESVEHVQFEDHQGTTLDFREVFHDRPSIVVFFYTRCDNPLKCSLTVTKLAQVHRLLGERRLADQIQTVAITYDPEFDLPSRLAAYALNRNVLLDGHHRMLRTIGDFGLIRDYFGLGVNFIDSFVNRHRLEVYVLDQQGQIAASFQRLHWNVEQIVDRAAALLMEHEGSTNASTAGTSLAGATKLPPVSAAVATLVSAGVAFFPKCPVCWAAYLSLFGIAGLERIPYAPALQPLLVALMLFNLVCLWYRARATRRIGGFTVALIGVLTLLILQVGLRWEAAAPWGVALTFAGSVWCVFPASQAEIRAPQESSE